MRNGSTHITSPRLRSLLVPPSHARISPLSTQTTLLGRCLQRACAFSSSSPHFLTTLKELRQITHIDPANSLSAQRRINISTAVRRNIHASPIAIAHSKANTRRADNVADRLIESPCYHKLCPSPCVQFDKRIPRAGDISESPWIKSEVIARDARRDQCSFAGGGAI